MIKVVTHSELVNAPGILRRMVQEGEELYAWAVIDAVHGEIYAGTYLQALSVAKRYRRLMGYSIHGVYLMAPDADGNFTVPCDFLEFEETIPPRLWGKTGKDKEMNISDKKFNLLWGEALISNDVDQYSTEWAISSIWGDGKTYTEADLLSINAHLVKIWEVAHMDINTMRTTAGLTQRAFATKFCIPLRTVEDWCRGGRTPPDYIRLLFARELGLL